MGENLDKPITKKVSLDGENEIIKYGMSEMQGYKKSVELFTLKNLVLINQNKNLCLFGLFDGHNGPEISKYLSLNFSKYLTENQNFINNDYKLALTETFLKIDNSFKDINVHKELSKYTSKITPNFPELNLIENETQNISKFVGIFDPRNLVEAKIPDFCGSCGLVVLIADKTVFIANAGNSRCIPINTKDEIMKDKINKEHIINDKDEIKRMKEAYGLISINKELEDDQSDDDEEEDIEYAIENKLKPREFLPLLVTRGFGNMKYKNIKYFKDVDQYISAEPEIIEIPLEDLNYLIICNSAVFEENKNNQITNYFLDKMKSDENKKISTIIEDYFDEIIIKNDKKEENDKKEVEEEEEKEDDRVINNMACIIIKFKHNNNEVIEGNN